MTPREIEKRNEKRQELRERNARNAGKPCSVKGCTKARHTVARFCPSHAMRAQRYGDPTKRAVTKAQLRPYQKQAAAFLRVNLTHPAITLVTQELDRLLTDAISFVKGKGVYWKPTRHEVHGRTQIELRRLKDHGAMGIDLLSACLALHLFCLANPRTVETFTEAYNFALARAVLSVRPWKCHQTFSFETGKPPRAVQNHMPTQVLRQLGKDLSTSLHLVLREAAKAVDEMSRAPTRAQKIAASLEAQPLVTTNAVPTQGTPSP